MLKAEQAVAQKDKIAERHSINLDSAIVGVEYYAVISGRVPPVARLNNPWSSVFWINAPTVLKARVLKNGRLLTVHLSTIDGASIGKGTFQKKGINAEPGGFMHLLPVRLNLSSLHESAVEIQKAHTNMALALAQMYTAGLEERLAGLKTGDAPLHQPAPPPPVVSVLQKLQSFLGLDSAVEALLNQERL